MSAPKFIEIEGVEFAADSPLEESGFELTIPSERSVSNQGRQCGLCKAACPEKVVSLVPRLGFGAAPRILKQEEPYPCIRCGKPFGVRSTIERIIAKLEGSHWMYQQSPARLDLIRMCDVCSVVAATEADFDPQAAPRPRLRTTEDYLREREQ